MLVKRGLSHKNVESRQFVSFPKSGRTWLRFVFHQLAIEKHILFHHDGFEFNDGSKPPHDYDLHSRLSRYAGTGPVVYLRRDPRDVMVSLYYQVTGRFSDFFNYEGTLSDFIRDEYFGANVLANFRQMWAHLEQLPNVLTIDYEECQVDLIGVVRRVIDHFDFQPSESALLAAVTAASFDNMKQVEEAGAFPEPWLNLRQGAPKVRNGLVGAYVSKLGQEDLAFLNNVFQVGQGFR